MRIIVTDTGLIWNHKNPMLKKCRDAVMVVCLNGEKVTDEYECFVSPYKLDENDLEIGTSSKKYLALESVADKLNSDMRYHDAILFLTDENLETLYPFFVLKDRNSYNALHLCAMSPWRFETEERIKVYKYLLSNLECVRSFLYIDSNEILDSLNDNADYDMLLKTAYEKYTELFPRILTEIYDRYFFEKQFFDFKTMRYVSLKDGFDDIDVNAEIEKINDIDFPVYPKLTTRGLCIQPEYPEDNDDTRASIEELVVRPDGKQICNMLREKRILLAKANNIPFESEFCPSIGACGGTCEKCDREVLYLAEKLNEIPENKRVYPYFDIEED